MFTQFQIKEESLKNICIIGDTEITNSTCTFTINGEASIQLSLFLAIAHSSIFANIVLNNNRQREMAVNVEFKGRVDKSFYQKLDDALHMKPVSLSADDVYNFAQFGKTIGNNSFLIPLTEEYQKLHNDNDISLENAVQRLREKVFLNMDPIFYEKEVELIAKNFDDVAGSLLSMFSDSAYSNAFDYILTNENLTLKNEDTLLQFIIDLSSRNQYYEYLFKYVWIEYCSSDLIKIFLQYVKDNICINQSINSVIQCISRKLILEQYPISQFNYIAQRKLHVNIDSNTNNEGILSTENKLNNVNMNCSSSYSGSLTNLLNLNDNSEFATSSSRNSWISASLKNNKPFILSKYLLKGRPNNNTSHALLTWKLEGKKKSDNNWIRLDVRDDIVETMKTKEYPILCSEELIEVKLTQVGYNSSGSDYLYLGGFEIFGIVL